MCRITFSFLAWLEEYGIIYQEETKEQSAIGKEDNELSSNIHLACEVSIITGQKI